MSLNRINSSMKTPNFSLEGNNISSVQFDLSAVDMRLLESLGFKCSEKEIQGKYYYDIVIPNSFIVRSSGISKHNDYFGYNHRGNYDNSIQDYIIENAEGKQFCILGGILTKSIKELEEDISQKESIRLEERNKISIKESQDRYLDSLFSTLELGSYRKEKIEIGLENGGGFLPACFISNNVNIEKLEKLGFELNINEKYPSLYDITIPSDFKLSLGNYNLKILSNNSEINFYYKNDLGKITNLDLKEIL